MQVYTTEIMQFCTIEKLVKDYNYYFLPHMCDFKLSFRQLITLKDAPILIIKEAYLGRYQTSAMEVNFRNS